MRPGSSMGLLAPGQRPADTLVGVATKVPPLVLLASVGLASETKMRQPCCRPHLSNALACSTPHSVLLAQNTNYRPISVNMLLGQQQQRLLEGADMRPIDGDNALRLIAKLAASAHLLRPARASKNGRCLKVAASWQKPRCP